MRVFRDMSPNGIGDALLNLASGGETGDSVPFGVYRVNDIPSDPPHLVLIARRGL
jgi:hypothetical protein